MNETRILARAVADSITVTTPGRVTWHQIRRKRAPIWGIIGWLPVAAALLLAAFAVITR